MARIRALVEFTSRVGLPNTLTEVDIDVDDLESLTIVVESATATGETIHNMPFEVTTESLVAALISGRAPLTYHQIGRGPPSISEVPRRVPRSGAIGYSLGLRGL